MSRTFAVGDVHGCDVALDVLLDRLELSTGDRLIQLGDLIDRGPDSRRVVQMLIDVGQTCRLDFVMGNHEQMLLDALGNFAVADAWFDWGGAETLASYGGHLSDIPEEHLDFLAAGLPYVETATDICVHAHLEPGLPLKDQSVASLRWAKMTGFESPHESGKRVICGHTRVPGEVPVVQDGWVMIDTGAYAGGYLTAVELASGEILQSRQSGEFRRGVFLAELS